MVVSKYKLKISKQKFVDNSSDLHHIIFGVDYFSSRETRLIKVCPNLPMN